MALANSSCVSEDRRLSNILVRSEYDAQPPSVIAGRSLRGRLVSLITTPGALPSRDHISRDLGIEIISVRTVDDTQTFGGVSSGNLGAEIELLEAAGNTEAVRIDLLGASWGSTDCLGIEQLSTSLRSMGWTVRDLTHPLLLRVFERGDRVVRIEHEGTCALNFDIIVRH
jgi:hypothetical protein